MQLELSVIIVNYNGIKYLKECLDSLDIKLQGISSEIIIIDNNSKDESCDYIKKNYPNVVLIESKINFGFGKGNNEAVKIAKGQNLLLLNNDTILKDNLNPILSYLTKDQTIGVLGINMLDAEGNYLPVVGAFPNRRNMFQLKKLLDVDQDLVNKKYSKESYNVDWLSGSFLMLSKKTFDKINGFDEDYFLYVEDVDFCKKIQKLGLKRVFLPNYSYTHFVGFNKTKNEMLIKGYQIYISKHFKGFGKWILLFILQTNKFVKIFKKTLKID